MSLAKASHALDLALLRASRAVGPSFIAVVPDADNRFQVGAGRYYSNLRNSTFVPVDEATERAYRREGYAVVTLR